MLLMELQRRFPRPDTFLALVLQYPHSQEQRFTDSVLEEQYQGERREQLAKADMQSAVLFVLLWAHDAWRFLGSTPLALIKATIWMAAVGMKPVYVMLVVGKPFYLEYRAWIISFTKIVFAVHPPGEGLHLLQLAGANQAPEPLPSTAATLWTLANGMRLPYMLVTGLGWRDFCFNVPVQLALIGRAIRDNQAQCATPFFTGPQTQALLRALANRLTSLLSTSLSLGAGIKGQQASFPAHLDPCCALGAWAALCFGFLLTTLALAAGERNARTSFARRHTTRLTGSERESFSESTASGSWATWALFAYICLLAWQAVVAAYAWAGGERVESVLGEPIGGANTTTNASADAS